jgi:hypothetical protein
MKNNIKKSWFGNVGYWVGLAVLFSGEVLAGTVTVNVNNYVCTSKCGNFNSSGYIHGSCPPGYVMTGCSASGYLISVDSTSNPTMCMVHLSGEGADGEYHYFYADRLKRSVGIAFCAKICN